MESVQYLQSVAHAFRQLVSAQWQKATQCERNVPFRKHITPFVSFPCLRGSPLRSVFLNTQFTQVAIDSGSRKVTTMTACC